MRVPNISIYARHKTFRFAVWQADRAIDRVSDGIVSLYPRYMYLRHRGCEYYAYMFNAGDLWEI